MNGNMNGKRGRPKTKKEWSGMPASVAALKEIATMVKSSFDSLRQIVEEKEQLKELFDEVHAKYGMPRRLFNNLCKMAYYNNASEELSKGDEMKEAWDALNKVL